MNRLLVVLGVAVLAAGCGSDCPHPALRIYWTPGASGPVAGFSVPGLVAAGFPAELDCTAAGLTGAGARVEVRVNDTPVDCAYPDPCVGRDWACTTGGVDIAGGSVSRDGNKVEVFGWDELNNLKYYGRRDGISTGCNGLIMGVTSAGQAGTLGIDYAFLPLSPPQACRAGSSIVWDLRAGTPPAAFDAGSIACGGTNPFLTNGGAAVPAGVYTLVNVAEVVGATSYHAYCSGTPFVHAGPETLIVDMAASSATCF